MPSAELIGKTEIDGHKLTFHKKSNDGSGKCNFFETGSDSEVVHGAIYSLNPDHKSDLDRFEGLGYGYINSQVLVEHSGIQYPCFTYQAQQSHIDDELKPYHWYKQLVLLGAEYLDFPEPYIDSIKAIESSEDPDQTRKAEKERLIEQIKNYC
ncbi:gamma-glutamylcyclotransferase [bacterium]|nr:gamma-glutamylcyclotransferase [bacterium]